MNLVNLEISMNLHKSLVRILKDINKSTLVTTDRRKAAIEKSNLTSNVEVGQALRQLATTRRGAARIVLDPDQIEKITWEVQGRPECRMCHCSLAPKLKWYSVTIPDHLKAGVLRNWMKKVSAYAPLVVAR